MPHLASHPNLQRHELLPQLDLVPFALRELPRQMIHAGRLSTEFAAKVADHLLPTLQDAEGEVDFAFRFRCGRLRVDGPVELRVLAALVEHRNEIPADRGGDRST